MAVNDERSSSAPVARRSARQRTAMVSARKYVSFLILGGTTSPARRHERECAKSGVPCGNQSTHTRISDNWVFCRRGRHWSIPKALQMPLHECAFRMRVPVPDVAKRPWIQKTCHRGAASVYQVDVPERLRNRHLD